MSTFNLITLFNKKTFLNLLSNQFIPRIKSTLHIIFITSKYIYRTEVIFASGNAQ